MDIFNNNFMDIDYGDCKVRIPTPAAYVLHKLIINSDRASEKSKKDLIAIKGLLLQIKRAPKDFKELTCIFNSDIIGRKGRNKINETCRANNINLTSPLSTDEITEYQQLILSFNHSDDEKNENSSDNSHVNEKKVSSWHDDFDDYEL